MSLLRSSLDAALGGCLAAALSTSSAVAAPAQSHLEAEPPALGLMGTIPIYWGVASALEDHINGRAEPHWARGQIERGFSLQPLAVIEAGALEKLSFLLLAQPRALSPAENVALDAWVRGGGKLLLFADPMMTGHSDYPLGDPRRPQDVTLLTPLLDHWGLPLQFDEAQPAGERQIAADGNLIPVRLAGRFDNANGGSGCILAAEGVLARCRIGKGSVVVLADAALLDHDAPPFRAGEALDWLLNQAFGFSGEKTGRQAVGDEGRKRREKTDS